jgi:hypothetical protein
MGGRPERFGGIHGLERKLKHQEMIIFPDCPRFGISVHWHQ